MPDSYNEDAPTLGEAGAEPESHPRFTAKRAIRQHWLVIVVTALVVSLAFTAVAFIRPPAYTASTRILLQPLKGTAYSHKTSSSQHNPKMGLETETKLLSSSGMERRATGYVHGNPAPDASKLTAKVIPDTQVVEISYSGMSVGSAERGADAFAKALLASRKAQSVEYRDGEVGTLKKRVGSGQQNLEAALKQKKNGGGAAASQTRVLVNHLETSKAKLAKAKGASTDPGHVVTPASPTSALQRFVQPLIIAAGIVVGLALGVVLALIRLRRRDRVNPEDVAMAGKHVLAHLDGPGAESDDGGTTDGYRAARTGLLATVPAPSVVAVTSVRSTHDIFGIAPHLATTLAKAGYATAVIDLADPEVGLAPYFDHAKTLGLFDVLSKDADLDAALTAEGGVQVLTSGTQRVGAKDLFDSRGFHTVLAAMRGRFDYVLLAVPALSSPVGVAGAASADSNLLAVSDSDTYGSVEETVARSVSQGVVLSSILTVSTKARRRRQTRAKPDGTEHTVQAPTTPAANLAQARTPAPDSST